MELKHSDSPEKKNFLAQLLGMTVRRAVFWDIKETITFNFLEKNAQTIKSTSYY